MIRTLLTKNGLGWQVFDCEFEQVDAKHVRRVHRILQAAAGGIEVG